MILSDARYALRLMRRSPGFTAAVVLSLALGIGANTAIFSLFHTIVLRPLPVARPGEIVQLAEQYPGEPRAGYWSYNSLQHFRTHSRTLESITGTGFDNLASLRTAEHGDPETMVLETVMGNYFAMLGVQPAAGRLVGPQDAGSRDAVVVSWRL
ncbi:MAG: hypothetical protein FJW31_19260 [Acidobacteria bacterium]|nr:hypothetical protein [Acidobacteriota bacterium]